MGDFIELGLEGADKLIDKHFDKVPDKYTDPETYKHPIRKLSKDQSGRRQGKSRRSRRDSFERQTSPPYSDMDGRPRNDGNSSTYLQDGPFITPPLYSQQPPHLRPEYVPAPTVGTVDYRYESPPRRPAHRRRSSSYHGPREEYFSDDDRQVGRPRRGSMDIKDKMRDKADRYQVKHEIRDQFTKSKEGIAGGVVGALVGGWAAHEALKSQGRDRGNGNAALTLLGAAVGGLAANVVIDKWEDGKEKTRQKEERWEEKWDDDRSSGGRSRRGDRDSRSRYEDDDDDYYRR